MATVVLGAVGGAVGGPVGAAIGSLAGRALDGALLRPGRREGPRLTELAVQLSSYGTPIAPLFGTMRVAGTVIWAADLIERRSSTGGRGKGAAGVTEYSYAASFAVLLSAREVAGVGRVWADGKLLRGAAGDLKVAGAMRLHSGSEDQAPDPLIASAEGALAPAHRGCAYAVFEGLALADFGNRIPSLTFEVVADAAPVAVGAIAAALAPEVRGGGGAVLGGFAGGGGSVRAVLATLASAGGGWFAGEGAGLVLADGSGVAGRLGDAGVRSEGRAPAGGRSVAAAEDAPRTLTLSHYDPARDYQTGVQRARRPGAGWREDRVELPAAIEAGAARAMAARLLREGDAARTRRTLVTGFAGLALRPGAVVEVDGEGAARWRIEQVASEGLATAVTLVLLPGAAPAVAAAASSGRVAAAPDRVVGATQLLAAELPALDDTLATAPRISVVADGGPGWRAAPLLLSRDGGASWSEAGATAAAGVVGTVAAAGAASLEVVLAPEAMLGDGDEALLAAGGNLALAGEELVQWHRAVPLGEGRWRLADLVRGVRGTEWASVQAGARFAVLGAATTRVLDLPLDALGQSVWVMAAGVGDGVTPATVQVAVTGASVAPPAPVGLTAVMDAGGDTVVSWTRRSRLGWRWSGAEGTLPLGEEREAYRVAVIAQGATRVVEVGVPRLILPAAERQGRALRVEVQQLGTLAPSRAAVLMLPALA